MAQAGPLLQELEGKELVDARDFKLKILTYYLYMFSNWLFQLPSVWLTGVFMLSCYSFF